MDHKSYFLRNLRFSAAVLPLFAVTGMHAVDTDSDQSADGIEALVGTSPSDAASVPSPIYSLAELYLMGDAAETTGSTLNDLANAAVWNLEGNVTNTTGYLAEAIQFDGVTVNEWHHVVLVIDQTTGKWTTYLDGVSSATER